MDSCRLAVACMRRRKAVIQNVQLFRLASAANEKTPNDCEQMLGSTNPLDAEVGSIRGDLCVNPGARLEAAQHTMCDGVALSLKSRRASLFEVARSLRRQQYSCGTCFIECLELSERRALSVVSCQVLLALRCFSICLTVTVVGTSVMTTICLQKADRLSP